MDYVTLFWQVVKLYFETQGYIRWFHFIRLHPFVNRLIAALGLSIF